jgi:hypothetical protein
LLLLLRNRRASAKKLCIVLLATAAAAVGYSQALVSATSNGQLYPAIAKHRYEKLFKDVEKPTISPEKIRLFKALYTSRTSDGRLVTVTGLVAIPNSGAPKGLVIYYHGTTADRENVPSRYRGNPTPADPDLAVLAFATAGYMVAAPDYLGLGDHFGFHPYPMGSVNSWSGIDLIKPAREIAKQNGLPVGKDLFVTGYSEGGAVAMWATRRMAGMSDPDYLVTRSAPLSGPYDLSDTQVKSMLDGQSNIRWLGARVYFAAYAGRSIQKYTGIDLEEFFTPSFASYIPYVFNLGLKDEETIKKLASKAFQLGAIRDLNRVLKLEFRNDLKDRNILNPMVEQLVANDCYNWSPKSPMYLFCVKDDFLIPKENTLKTIATMRARGVGSDMVRHYVFPGRKFDHMTGALPGLILARKFFDGGFDAVPVSD